MTRRRDGSAVRPPTGLRRPSGPPDERGERIRPRHATTAEPGMTSPAATADDQTDSCHRPAKRTTKTKLGAAMAGSQTSMLEGATGPGPVATRCRDGKYRVIVPSILMRSGLRPAHNWSTTRGAVRGHPSADETGPDRASLAALHRPLCVSLASVGPAAPGSIGISRRTKEFAPPAATRVPHTSLTETPPRPGRARKGT